MLDMYSDFTMHQAQLGLHIEVLEMDDLQDRVEDVPEEAVTARLDETQEAFEVDEGVDQEDLRWSAHVSAGLDRLADDFDLDALAYYYRGTGSSVYERLGTGLILGNSLLTARGIPASGEGDLKNAVAMKVMDSLGAGDLSPSSTPWISIRTSFSWATTALGTSPSATASRCLSLGHPLFEKLLGLLDYLLLYPAQEVGELVVVGEPGVSRRRSASLGSRKQGVERRVGLIVSLVVGAVALV